MPPKPTVVQLPQQQQQTALKLPFPVLNDKRDHKTVLNTLETKYNELRQKRDVNKKSIDSVQVFTSDKSLMEKNQAKLDKLKQLDKAIGMQQDKLSKQIDYLKLYLNVDALRARNLMGDAEMIARMTHTLNEMYNYMKNENKTYVLKQKQLSGQTGGDLNESGLTGAGDATHGNLSFKLRTNNGHKFFCTSN